MKTAVEELAIALYEGGYLQGDSDEIQELVDKTKEMEKEQIINAVDGFPLANRGLNGDEYYNETYGGNNMSNKQQTAVEYFAKEIFHTIELLKIGYVNDQDFLNSVIVIRDKAKEMEKEQIKNSVVWFDITDRRPCEIEKDVEKYYNKTYGGN